MKTSFLHDMGRITNPKYIFDLCDGEYILAGPLEIRISNQWGFARVEIQP